MKSKQLVKSKRARSKVIKSKRARTKVLKSKSAKSKVIKSKRAKMQKSYFTGAEIAAAAALAIAVGGGVYYINNREISKLNAKFRASESSSAEKFQDRIRELTSELYNERAKNRKN